MTIKAFHGTFAVDSTKTAGSTHTITPTGATGYTGRYLRLFMNGTTSGTDTVERGDLVMSLGVALSSTKRYATARFSDDANTSTDEASSLRNDSCICAISASAVTGRYDFNNFGSDGAFTFDVDVQMPGNYVVQYLLIADTAGELSGAIDAGTIQNPTNSPYTGQVSISSLSFTPVFLEFFGSGIPSSLNAIGTGSSAGAIQYGFGKGAGAGEQYVISAYARDAQVSTTTTRYAFDDEVLANVANNTNGHRATIVSLQSGGFTIDFLEAALGARYAVWVAWSGANFTVGDLLTQTDTATEVTETVTGTPLAITMASHNASKNTQDGYTSHMAFSFGTAVSTSNRSVMAVRNENNAADTICTRLIEYDEIYGAIDSSQALEGLGDISDIASGSFKYINDDADPSQKFAVWWTISGVSNITISAARAIATATARSPSVIGLQIIQAARAITTAVARNATLYLGGASGSQGPSFPGTTATDSSSGGTIDWTNPGSITADDATYATAASTSIASTYYLKATNFGFTIPGDATITGVEAVVNRKASDNGTLFARDSKVRIIKGGTIGSTDKADGTTKWPTTDGDKTYGGTVDTWGETLTPTDINASNFGLALAADIRSTGATVTAYVDSIKLTVHYTTGSGLVMAARAIATATAGAITVSTSPVILAARAIATAVAQSAIITTTGNIVIAASRAIATSVAQSPVVTTTGAAVRKFLSLLGVG